MKSVINTFAALVVLTGVGVVATGQETLPEPEKNSIRTLSLDDQGILSGRISVALASFDATSPVENVAVSLSRNGLELHSARTNSKGLFEFKGVKPGKYNLLAAGSSALLATGIEIVEKDERHQLFELVAMPAPMSVARKVLKSQSRLLSHSQPSPAVNTELVSLRAVSPTVTEGTVSGRVSDLAGRSTAAARVLLIRGDEIVQETEAANGSYRFANVKAGIYSLMVVAKDGFAVVGLEVQKASKTTNVSFRVQQGADVTLAEGQTFRLIQDQEDATADEEDATADEEEDVAFVDGAGAVVVSGGGGGGGAFAGLAGLTGLSGLAALGDNQGSPK